MSEYFGERHSLGLTSVSSPLILGTRNHIHITDPDLIKEIKHCKGHLEEINQYSKSEFAIDGTENPHPRFPGLMKSIRERRGEKVKILVPIYPDTHTFDAQDGDISIIPKIHPKKEEDHFEEHID